MSAAGRTQTPNDLTRGLTAAIEGFFAVMWFGWGQADADVPGWFPVLLIAGTVLAVPAGIAGVVLAVRSKGQPSVLRDDDARRRYLWIVRIEFGALIAGGVVLGLTGLGDWAPVWVAAGVGIHFVPLADVFHDPRMVPIGVTIVLVAIAALVTGLVSDVAPSSVTGPGVGLCLLVGAVRALLLVPADSRRTGTVGGAH